MTKMQINHNKIRCFWCNKDISFAEIELNVLYNGSISCKQEHLIGDVDDLEWKIMIAQCPYFYLYYQDTMCKCVQQKAQCYGIEDDCNYPIGKMSYEQYTR